MWHQKKEREKKGKGGRVVKTTQSGKTVTEGGMEGGMEGGKIAVFTHFKYTENR